MGGFRTIPIWAATFWLLSCGENDSAPSFDSSELIEKNNDHEASQWANNSSGLIRFDEIGVSVRTPEGWDYDVLADTTMLQHFDETIARPMTLGLVKFKKENARPEDQYNAEVTVLWERLPGQISSANYLRSVRTVLERSELEYACKPRLVEREFSGATLFELNCVFMPYDDLTMHQVLHAKSYEGFAISVISTYMSEGERSDIEDVLHGVHFDEGL